MKQIPLLDVEFVAPISVRGESRSRLIAGSEVSQYIAVTYFPSAQLVRVRDIAKDASSYVPMSNIKAFKIDPTLALEELATIDAPKPKAR